MSSILFKILSANYSLTNRIYLISKYKEDLTLNNLQGLICHQTKPNIYIYIYMYIYIYIYIIIIIIMLYHQHGYPWPSFATPPYRSSLLVGPQGYIPYPQRAAVCRFELVILLLLSHMRGSIGEHHLWAHPCFSSSVLHVWLSNFDSFRVER